MEVGSFSDYNFASTWLTSIWVLYFLKSYNLKILPTFSNASSCTETQTISKFCELPSTCIPDSNLFYFCNRITPLPLQLRLLPTWFTCWTTIVLDWLFKSDFIEMQVTFPWCLTQDTDEFSPHTTNPHSWSQLTHTQTPLQISPCALTQALVHWLSLVYSAIGAHDLWISPSNSCSGVMWLQN
jgi:hypothetical protein